MGAAHGRGSDTGKMRLLPLSEGVGGAPWGFGAGRRRSHGTVRRADVRPFDVCPAPEMGHKKIFLVIILTVGKIPDLDSSRESTGVTGGSPEPTGS